MYYIFYNNETFKMAYSYELAFEYVYAYARARSQTWKEDIRKWEITA